MLYAARRAVMRHTTWMRFSGYVVLLFFPLVIIGMNLAAGHTVGDAVRTNGVIYAGLVIIWLVGLPLLTRWSSARMLRTTPSFQGELEYSFTTAGMKVRSPVSFAEITWATFVRAIETREFFLLFHNKQIASFLPKSAFGSTEEQQEFRSLVSNQLGDRARWQAGLSAPLANDG